VQGLVYLDDFSQPETALTLGQSLTTARIVNLMITLLIVSAIIIACVPPVNG